MANLSDKYILVSQGKNTGVMKACEAFKKEQLKKKIEKKLMKQDKQSSEFIFVDSPLLTAKTKDSSQVLIEEFRQTFGGSMNSEDAAGASPGEVQAIDFNIKNYWQGREISIEPNQEETDEIDQDKATNAILS